MRQELQPTDPAQIGPFRLLGVLGSSPSGKVYLGVAGRGLAAVRVVHPGLARDPQFAARFADLVATARQVRGPGIAPVVDADPHAPLPWLATEYVRGVPLDRAVQAAGPLPSATATALATGLAHALATTHAAGLVHRDVAPGNVLLAADGPYLLDRGIAGALTAEPMIGPSGTSDFRSPEQTDGEPTGPSADVFSLGAVVAYAALGRGPFDEPAGLPGLDKSLRALLRACSARRPTDRPTAVALAAWLGPPPSSLGAPAGAWLPGPVAAMIPPPPDVPTTPGTIAFPVSPAPAPPPPPGSAPAPPHVSRRGVLAGIAAAVGLIAAGGAIATWTAGRSPTTSSSSGDIPLSEAPATGAVRWTASIPVSDANTIAVAGDTVLVGGQDTVVALDAGSGVPRWQFGAPGPGANLVALSATGSTVAVTTRSGLTVLDLASGHERWRRKEYGLRVTAASDAVYLCQGYTLYAFDAATGAARWVFEVDSPYGIDPSPTVDGDLVVVCDGRGVYGLDVATGMLRWRHAGHGYGAAVVDETVYVRGAEGFAALDVGSGTERWVSRLDLHPAPAEVIVADGSVVFQGRDWYNTRALDAATGAARWGPVHWIPPRAPGEAIALMSTSWLGAPEPASRHVYAGYATGRVIAAEAATGTPTWVYEASPRSGVFRAMTVSDGVAYIAKDDGGVSAVAAS